MNFLNDGAQSGAAVRCSAWLDLVAMVIGLLLGCVLPAFAAKLCKICSNAKGKKPNASNPAAAVSQRHDGNN